MNEFYWGVITGAIIVSFIPILDIFSNRIKKGLCQDTQDVWENEQQLIYYREKAEDYSCELRKCCPLGIHDEKEG